MNRREWLQLCLHNPPPVTFKMRELAELSGLPAWRIRRYLKDKGVIPPASNGSHFEIDSARMIEFASEFWDRVKKRIERELDEAVAA